ncbi:Serine/threonine-protein kinase MRCK gamma like [Quillaja saponaria]|uniref:Serine/threonine-protein kinase MRCK gamma like n=1 Tax=Quillaja saponaria TaxID=32244 RepID=A0AAD7KYZ8_QUISA|nr:Serine/threonine-protein kinase MRCK gamma like [Quillaja saponaria]
MRFFLEFVPCCGHVITRRTVEATSSPPSSEERRSLVPLSRSLRRRKRGRQNSMSSADWKPSLGSISEDNVVAEKVDERNGASGSDRKVKRKSGSDDRVHNRTYNDDYVRVSLPTVMPTFSATPFMF